METDMTKSTTKTPARAPRVLEDTRPTETSAPASAPASAPVPEKKKGWRIKAYYVDTQAYAAAQAELSKAPNQVRIMMAHFAENFNEVSAAAQGRVMCQSAIDKGGLKTVIEPHVLFAYYRSTMEKFGLRLAD